MLSFLAFLALMASGFMCGCAMAAERWRAATAWLLLGVLCGVAGTLVA